MNDNEITYRVAIKHDDDTLHDTKFWGMTKYQAKETMEALFADIPRLAHWSGLAVTDDNGDVYEEVEW